MNNTLLSVGIMFILLTSGVLIGKFFGISTAYYLPFLLWGIALCLFNIM